VKDSKETDLLDFLKKDEKFRGMMEMYSIFRTLIAHERMTDINDKNGRITKMSIELSESLEKLNYIDDAMGFLVRNLNNGIGLGKPKENNEIKMPFTEDDSKS
jgi:hypothetical protein